MKINDAISNKINNIIIEKDITINKLAKDNNIVPVRVLFFKSMTDISKEMHISILCYKSDKFIVYIILNNKLAYVYFLNSDNEKI